MHVVVDRLGIEGERKEGRRAYPVPFSARRSFGIFIEPLNQRRCQMATGAGNSKLSVENFN